MRALALIALLASSSALAQSNATTAPTCTLVESVEGQVCYLRCSGNQRLTGSLSVTAAANTCGYALPTTGSRYCIGSSGCYFTYNASNFIDAVCGNGLRISSGQLRLPQSIPIWFGTGIASDQADVINFDTSGTFEFSGSTTDSVSAISTRISSQADLTTAGAKITCFGDNAGTSVSDKACIDLNGNYTNSALNGTAGSGTGVTVNETSQATRGFVHKVTVTSAAMTAAGTTDITIWTLPAKSRVTRVVADVTTKFIGGALTAVTLRCGASAGGTDFLLSGDVFTAAITLGDGQAEFGTKILGGAGFTGDIPAWSSTQVVSCRWTCTTANCNAATQGAATFYIEGLVYP